MLTKKGQSVIEVIVAIAIFVILAGGTVTVVLGSFLSSRQGEEETKASFLAREGVDSVESIRNQSWSNLADGPHGLTNLSGKWAFSGTGETINKYTRVVTISSVQRSAGGNIVAAGGTNDPNTKQVVSKVTWNFTPAQQSTVDMTQFFTNWQTSFVSPIAPTPLPTPTSCTGVCLNNGYSLGTCRANATACTNFSETRLSTGDVYCTGGANADTCCCAE